MTQDDRDFDRLVHAILDDVANEEDIARFRALLRQDPGRMDDFIRAQDLHALLRTAALSEGEVSKVLDATSRSTRNGMGAGRSWWRAARVPLALAAGLLIAVGVWRFTTVETKVGGSDVATGKGQTVTLRFEGEETVVDVLENTRLNVVGGSVVEGAAGEKLLKTGPGKVIQLESGSIKVSVAKQEEGRSFVLATPHAEARVVGTAFDLRVSETSSRLDVIKGVVRYTRLSDGKSLEVRERQSVVAGKGVDFAVQQSIFEVGGEYVDGRTLFSDTMTDGLANWDVLVSDGAGGWRLATEAEISSVVREPQPDDRWRTPEQSRGIVLCATREKPVALRMKQAITTFPISVSLLRQAEVQTRIEMSFGDVVKRELVRDLSDQGREATSLAQLRWELIPIEQSADGDVFEERYFYGRLWFVWRTTLKRGSDVRMTLRLTVKPAMERKVLIRDFVVKQVRRTDD